MPMTPFIGVRISWLMVARKALLASLAASAAARASRSRCALRSCSNARRMMAPTKTSGGAAKLRIYAQSAGLRTGGCRSGRSRSTRLGRRNGPHDHRVQRKKEGAQRADAMSEPPHVPRRRDSDDPVDGLARRGKTTAADGARGVDLPSGMNSRNSTPVTIIQRYQRGARSRTCSSCAAARISERVPDAIPYGRAATRRWPGPQATMG